MDRETMIISMLVFLLVLLMTSICFLVVKMSKQRYEKSDIGVERAKAKSRDTRDNIFGRIKNALLPFEMKSEEMRGLVIHPLGKIDQNNPDADQHIILAWKNIKLHQQLGILEVIIGVEKITLKSSSQPCPQGCLINWVSSSLEEEVVVKVINNVKYFIEQTMDMENLETVSGK
jgi:hypothetical protein